MQVEIITIQPSIVEKIIYPNSKSEEALLVMDEKSRNIVLSMKEAKELKTFLNKKIK